MQPFEITILGCSSATPTSYRNPSAQVVSVTNKLFLIDCGEGTQMQMRRFKIKFQKIDFIFISHLHGDHYYGLMGLLSSMHLLGRKHPLHLFAPAELKEIIEIQLKYSQTRLNYEVIFAPLLPKTSEVIYQDDKLIIRTIPLNHRINCTGFLISEKELPKKIVPEKIAEYNIPAGYLPLIKLGNDFKLPNGSLVSNAELTAAARKPLSYAYCSDTCYDESILNYIKDVDLLYHESTFMNDLAQRAKETFHSTASQAATIALKANVKKLMLGHYSARYLDLKPLLVEAKSVFPNTILSEEGEKYTVE